MKIVSNADENRLLVCNIHVGNTNHLGSQQKKEIDFVSRVFLSNSVDRACRVRCFINLKSVACIVPALSAAAIRIQISMHPVRLMNNTKS